MATQFDCIVCEQPSPRPIHQGVCWAWATPDQKRAAQAHQQEATQERVAATITSRWGTARSEDAPAVECPPHQWRQDSRGRVLWDEFTEPVNGISANIGTRCLKCSRVKLVVEGHFGDALYDMIQEAAVA